MFSRKYKPLNIVWETTLKCNMNCIHCGSSAGSKRKKELSTEEAVNVLNDLKKLGTNLVTMMGGEPFLRKDWDIIAEHIKNIGMELTIISNGFIIDKKIVSKLKKLNPYTVGISIDGGKKETHDNIRRINGSFEKCKKSLELLKKAGIRRSVITTVHKKNYTELPLLRKQLLNKDLAWQIQMATPVGRFPRGLMLSKEEFYSVALFIASTKKKYKTKEIAVLGAHNFGYFSNVLPNVMLFPWVGCQAGISTLGLTSNGGVKACMSLPDEYIAGNIRDKNFGEIWRDSDFASYNRNFKKDDLNGECKTCKYGEKCKGGCMTVSTSLTGEEHNNPYCLNLIEKNKILS
jgi:radical SAM protein with 4Fe4S-binding SPASM domain